MVNIWLINTGMAGDYCECGYITLIALDFMDENQ
jgi:hypothetical protein